MNIKQTAICAIITTLIFYMFAFSICCAGEVDMNIIAQIESSGNPLAHNIRTGARGLYQIRKIAWEDVQNHYPELKKYDYLEYCYNSKISRLFAKKYFNILKKYLKYYNKPITIKNLLYAYNAGIGNLINGRIPKESIEYVKKYILFDK